MPHAISRKFCSLSAEGDYYQLWLETEGSDAEETDSHQATGPYPIVQRGFEMPDDEEC